MGTLPAVAVWGKMTLRLFDCGISSIVESIVKWNVDFQLFWVDFSSLVFLVSLDLCVMHAILVIGPELTDEIN